MNKKKYKYLDYYKDVWNSGFYSGSEWMLSTRLTHASLTYIKKAKELVI